MQSIVFASRKISVNNCDSLRRGSCQTFEIPRIKCFQFGCKVKVDKGDRGGRGIEGGMGRSLWRPGGLVPTQWPMHTIYGDPSCRCLRVGCYLGQIVAYSVQKKSSLHILSLCLSFPVSLCLSLSVPLSVCMSVYVSASLFILQPIHR